MRHLKLQEIEGRLPAVSQDGRKLKRKVIYVYENDDDFNSSKQENQNQQHETESILARAG